MIIHEHGLLGEGLAQYLLSTAGMRARTVSAADDEAVRAALARRPLVVVFESAEPGRESALHALCPGAVLIDVSGVFTSTVADPPAVVLERILAAVGGPSAQPA